MKNKLPIIVAACVVVVAVGVVGALFATGAIGGQQAQETAAPTEIVDADSGQASSKANPLTGLADFKSSAIGVRPVAVVVENSEDARPQWNMNTPDIILEGEIEHSEHNDGTDSRMLWFYADYTSLPKKVGPMRSARPPFVKFSELFDSIFVHWGMSHSSGKYVGAATVFKKDKVDHINQMDYEGNSNELFGRDSSRNVDSWHTAYLKGEELPAAIEKYKFRTDINEGSFTRLNFGTQAQPMSDEACSKVKVKLAKELNHSTTWTYDESDKRYHSKNYKQDSWIDNVIVLFDKTDYVEKKNYKGAGSFNVNSTKSEIYSEHRLSGGECYVASQGTVLKGTWNCNDGKLHLLKADGEEITLNPGRSWIGWPSSNHGGTIKIS